MEELKKYIICPRCHSKNLPYSSECSNCGYDGLIGLDIVDDGEKTGNKTGEKTQELTGKMVRICEECGHHNPSTRRKCEECGEDINYIKPVLDNEETKARFIFTSIDGQYAYEILEQSVKIGRDYEMKEYLCSKMFSSRVQAEVTILDGKIYIRNLSNKQSTFVNNERVSDNESRELHDGDEIGLGGFVLNNTRQENAAYFTVRIDNCEG